MAAAYLNALSSSSSLHASAARSAVGDVRRYMKMYSIAFESLGNGQGMKKAKDKVDDKKLMER